jgi:hypothetical protein
VATLAALERQILDLQARISVRPVLALAVSIGERLAAAKRQVKHGAWTAWAKRLGMSARTAQIYMQIAKAKAQGSALFKSDLSLDRFLQIVRTAKRAASRVAIDELRAAAIEAGALSSLGAGFRLVHADCREYRGPLVDCIATDPPWQDIALYHWLGEFASEKLRPGGLLLVQASVSALPQVFDVFRRGGRLQYLWTLAIVYNAGNTTPYGRVLSCWRPVLAFANGRYKQSGKPLHSDTFTLPLDHTTSDSKQWHAWEQPLGPWVYWLGKMTLPGNLIADPFLGSGTIGLAVKTIGDRVFIGTDIDADNVKIARHRLGQG